jgi:quinol monooxygenase YgiN
MIAIAVTVTILPEKVELFERVTRELEAAVRANEPECEVYRMSKSRTRPLTYINMEIFSDQAALDRHMSSDYFLDAVQRMAGCMSGEPDIHFLDTLV